MTKTHFKTVIETNADGLKIAQVDNKEVEQKNEDGTTQKISYKKVKCSYEHPQPGGGKVRGRPIFSTPSLEQPRGVKYEKGKLSTFTTFDTTNPDVNEFISSKERTQTRGWVPQENIKIITKSGKTFAKASRGGDLYSGPNEDDEVVASYEKNDLMNVEDQNEDDTWYLVAAGGQDGFFATMRNKIAELLHNDKRCGYSNKSVDDIKRLIKDPVYYPIDPESGKPIEGKSPSMYFKCSYFAPRPKEKKKESYARYQVPGFSQCLDLETMGKSSLKLNSAVILLVDIYIGAGKIIPQYYITDAVVVDISEIKMPNELENELAQQALDEALVAKLAKQLAASKKFEAPKAKEDNKSEAIDAIQNGDDGDDGDDGEDVSFEDLISNQPKLQTEDGDIKATMKDIQIPGLPDED